MGTKVHYRNYFSLHDTMKNLNADAGNNWPPFYISKAIDENFYNGCLLSPVNEYMEYDKGMLKRTMLEHEAIFRKQVYELHRLYIIQKGLMAQFQKNCSFETSKHDATARTVSCTSQVQSDYATRMLQISHLHAMHNSQKKEKSRYNDDIISSINFFERNQQSSSFIRGTEALQRVAETESSFRKCPKTMLGHRLPDCRYIDDTERLEEFSVSSSLNKITCSRISYGDSDIELKLKLANGIGPSGKVDVCKFDDHHHKSLFTGLFSSNEPHKHAFFKETSDSFSHQVPGPRAHKEENDGVSSSLSSTRLSLENAIPNIFPEVDQKTWRGSICYNENGKLCPLNFSNSCSAKERNSVVCELIKLNANTARGIISTDSNGASIQFVHEKGNHLQIRNSDLGGKLPSVLANSLSSSLNFEGDGNDKNDASRPFSAIPSFNGTNHVKNFCSSYTPKVCNTAAGSLQVSSDLNSPPRFEGNSFSHLNDEIMGQSHSTSRMKFQFTNINLNEEAEVFFSGTRNPLISQQNKAASGADGKCKEPNRLPSQMDLGFSQIDPVFEKKTENVPSLSSCNLEVLSSPHKRESEIKINQLSDSLSTICPNIKQNLLSLSNEEKLVMAELGNTDSMPYDIKMHSSKKSPFMENNRSKSRNYIDLNSEFPIRDDSDCSDSSTKVKTDFPSDCSDPISVSRAVTLIDLEAPVHSITSSTLQEEWYSHEMFIKEAAENIIKLSSDGFKEKEGIHSSQSLPPSMDDLYLFAEIVLSEEKVVRVNEPQEDGFDLFEEMNLQLEEMKPEKLWCKPQGLENTEIEDKRSKVSFFLAKPRRAQGRKRRQKKDFQKDILPILATLSRQETIKDLRAIGEMMKASGIPWDAGTPRRKTWRNGALPRGSQKRRQTNASVSAAGAHINPPAALFVAGGADDTPAFGWVRMTRRCRSERCQPISIPATLTRDMIDFTRKV